MGKLFTSVINERLQNFLESMKKLMNVNLVFVADFEQ